jgi:hypothetical protein
MDDAAQGQARLTAGRVLCDLALGAGGPSSLMRDICGMNVNQARYFGVLSGAQHDEWRRAGMVCKTVGSAYASSNLAPATT